MRQSHSLNIYKHLRTKQTVIRINRLIESPENGLSSKSKGD